MEQKLAIISITRAQSQSQLGNLVCMHSVRNQTSKIYYNIKQTCLNIL